MSPSSGTVLLNARSRPSPSVTNIVPPANATSDGPMPNSPVPSLAIEPSPETTRR